MRLSGPKREKTSIMADPKEDIVERTTILNQAIWQKWNRFTWSGLVMVGTGLIVVSFGLLMQMGPYSPEGLVVGLGVILLLIGIVRLLIGLINPLAPNDLDNMTVPEEKALGEKIFKTNHKI